MRSFILLCSLLLCLTGCSKKESANKKTANFSTEIDLTTPDPRKVRDIHSITLVRNVYEGLMAYNDKAKVVPALATEITISPDKTEYTIKMLPSKWSDGKDVTAYDFEYSWKSSLNPINKVPNAAQLFVIKNAKAAYEEKASIDSVGIQVVDPHTLKITLEAPLPYFTELLATTPFFPVAKHAFVKAAGKELSPLEIPTNGPFIVTEWKPTLQYAIEKNPTFRNESSIKLDKVTFAVYEVSTALQMFEKGNLDWAGSPISTLPTDVIPILRKEKKLCSTPGAATQFLRLNVANPYLSQIKLRKALCLACDRAGLLDTLQSNFVAARGFVPPSMDGGRRFFPEQDVPFAQKYYKEAVEELKTEPITLSLLYVNNERNKTVAQMLQQNFQETLGLKIALEPVEGKAFFERIKKKNYTIALGNWMADLYDQAPFLAVFQYKDNGTNNTNWENSTYSKLIEDSFTAPYATLRFEKLFEAEKILMDEVPIIPLFHFSYNYVKSPRLHGVILLPGGTLDFQNAYVD